MRQFCFHRYVARAAASPSTVVSHDSGLRAQNADYPVGHEESFEPHTAPSKDLSVSLVSPQTILPPPTTSSASFPRWRFRRELLGSVQIAPSSSTVPGTARTNEAVLRPLVPRVVESLGAPALPMSNEVAFIACFDSTLLFGPKSPTLTTGQPAVRWSYVRLVKAAVAF